MPLARRASSRAIENIMSRFLPTLRGWAALVLPIIGDVVLWVAFPVRLIESGVGRWVQEPVAPSSWVLSGAWIVLCVGACVEAFRRGSWTDTIVLFLGVLLTFWLMREYCEFMVLRVRPVPAVPA